MKERSPLEGSVGIPHEHFFEFQQPNAYWILCVFIDFVSPDLDKMYEYYIATEISCDNIAKARFQNILGLCAVCQDCVPGEAAR